MSGDHVIQTRPAATGVKQRLSGYALGHKVAEAGTATWPLLTLKAVHFVVDAVMAAKEP